MMATGLFNWSRTPANNANSTYTWAEGMAPSSVNDSARGDKADVAQWRDDIAGAIVTGGTSTNYTLTSYSTFTSLALMSGQMIAFTPHATNGATVTLNVDSLGAKPLRPSPGVELLAGTLIQGTPYLALYNNSDAVWYLHGFYGNPYNVPLGSGMDYWLPTAPNSSFVFPIGQAISRTTYATLFAAMGTTYGVGDGSTTFNLPDKTGRVSAMKEAVGTRLTATYFGGVSSNLGAVGGLESDTLTAARLPASIPYTDPTHVHNQDNNTVKYTGSTAVINTGTTTVGTGGTTQAAGIGITINPGGGAPHNNVQPTIVCNYILRVI